MGGLLIDTLAYNFVSGTDEYDSKSFLYYDLLSRDFFKYLSELSDQDYYAAPGSRQRVKVRSRFQRKAKKAYDLCLNAIAAEKQKNVNDKWRLVYGRPFPTAKGKLAEMAANTASFWRNTEEFIEDRYPVDIRYSLRIECEVRQSGYRMHLLREMLAKRIPLLARKKLEFWVKEITVPQPFEIKWKVLNRGEVAKLRDCVRGQIWSDTGRMRRSESTNFRGDHIVECYAIKDGVVVAKDRIHVPIQADDDET